MNPITFVLDIVYPTICQCFIKIGEFVVSIDEPVKCITDCAALIAIIFGLPFISSLKNQKREAIFSFWSQLVVRLRLVYDNLKLNNALINNMYSSDFRSRYEEGTPKSCYIDTFKTQLSDLVEYLKTTDAQIPAYTGWSDDFNTIYRFISYTSSFDIVNPDSMFIDDFLEDYPDRTQICEEVCSAMSRVINNIHKEQVRYEKRLIPLYRVVLSRLRARWRGLPWICRRKTDS